MIVKFNAWDKFENKMILWKDLIKDKESEKLIPEILLNNERYIPLQFTGEYITKTTEEIYLGDVIRSLYYKHAENDLILDQEVYFAEGTFALRVKATNLSMDDCSYNNCPISWTGKRIKKLGNIYEGLKIDL